MSRNPSNRARRYDIDALRVIAFSILILYHVGMLYVPNWAWHIKSEYQTDWVKYLMLLVNQWRMPLLFLVSGIASSFLLSKLDVIAFLRSRSSRLLIPFAVGLMLIVPPQAYIQATANGSISANFGDMSYLDFLIRYFSFQTWPVGAFDGSEYGFTWNHLWFIPYLFVYTVLLVPIASFLRFSTIERRFKDMNLATLAILPILIQFSWQIAFNGNRDMSHALIGDGYAHAMYGTFFVLGYLISDKPSVWKHILTMRWISLIGAIFSYSLLIFLWFHSGKSNWPPYFEHLVVSLNQWLWLLAAMGWSATFLNRPSSWLSHANNCIYPWYILHQTVTIIAAYLLAKLSLGGFLEFIFVLLTTVLVCWTVTKYILGRQKLLKYLFGMK